jgi:hypothetical protein
MRETWSVPSSAARKPVQVGCLCSFGGRYFVGELFFDHSDSITLVGINLGQVL